MNILFIGNYRDGTGWGYAATAYIEALRTTDINLSVRPLYLSPRTVPIASQITDLEKRNFSTYDAIIQNVLPHFLVYDAAFGRNIALYHTETSCYGRTQWADRINCMDRAWVPCHQNLDAALTSGVTIDMNMIPIPCDPEKYQQSYKPLSLRDTLRDHFIFYTIGEFNTRKNLKALLSAFHIEFDLNEPVSLVIKTTPRIGEDEFTSQIAINNFCNQVKRSLKLFDKVENYKKEIVLSGNHSTHDIMRLHASCDCGVFPSYGEAWCLPAFDSMAMGKTPIVTAFGGFLQYISDEVGWLVPARMEPVYGTESDTFPDLHTGHEEWASISIAGLRTAMRQVYQNHDLRREKSKRGIEMIYEFTYQKIGELMKERLYDS